VALAIQPRAAFKSRPHFLENVMKKVFIVTDLGGGDGGKGGVVHKICCEMNAHTVVKVGGAQGSHGVRTSKGESFNFSHFGCGTLEGVRTHISSKMVIDPITLLYEGELLKYECGIRNVFELLTIDENALCVTPFHRIASRLRELSRKENPKGTVGLGVGEAVKDSEIYPELTICIRDIRKPDLLHKLEALRVQKLEELKDVIEGTFWDSDRRSAIELINSLSDHSISESVAKNFRDLFSACDIVPADYLENQILSIEGVVVFESSHGILTDRYYGFHPHTTRLRTLPQISLNLLKECDYKGDVVKLGVTRGYQIRHGAGPMVTENQIMTDKLLPGSSKDENRWQGKVRVGPLDLVALRYAINVCGGPEFFDGLAITWFDQIEALREWIVCDKYTETGNLRFFTENREIRVRKEDEPNPLDYQERLGKILRGCRPYLTSYPVPTGTNQEDMTELCNRVLQEKLKIQVKMISFGPTEEDKVCL